MAAMFVRQLQLIRKYRFFYREIADLLRQDPRLRRRFAQNRERRLLDLEKFMHALAGRGLLRLPQDARRLRSIVDVTWIVSENWLNTPSTTIGRSRSPRSSTATTRFWRCCAPTCAPTRSRSPRSPTTPSSAWRNRRV